MLIVGRFFLLLVILVLMHKLAPAVLALYGTCSLAAYLVYAYDKSAAEEKRRRIPERTLHLLALAGGWPGALFAQQNLRHKSRKLEFLAVFWGTVMLNCGLLWWWLR